MSNKLIHLTSSKNIINILESESIWFGDSFKTNDKCEGFYQQKIIYKALKHACKKNEYTQIKNLLKMNINQKRSELRVYLFCFSEE